MMVPATGLCLLLLVAHAATKGTRPYMEDSTCPRRPELTTNRKCEKKCRTDLDCRGRNRRCLCDDVCGRGCVRPGLRCPIVKQVFNGKFEMPPFNTFGAKVRYTCNEGYILSGQSERVCQGDGYWSGEAPTCETEGKCRDPPQVPHATHDGPRGQRVFPLGTQLTYGCDEGFSIDGFFRAMCVGEGRWVGPRMTCSPRRCGHPGDTQNGHREGNVFVYPNRVMYVCAEGYEMVGRPFRICQSSGEWSGTLPMCRPVRCSRLSAAANGQMHGSDFTYGAVVSFSCLPGFMLIGSQARTCRQDGTWSGRTATCAMVDCGQPGNFYNGYLDGQQTTFGSIVIFRCYGRTTFKGESMSTTCQESGEWSHPVPACWSKCEIPTIGNGSVVDYESGVYLEHGDTLKFACNSGYVPKNSSDIDCYNGTWSFVPKCVPAPCKERPPGIQQGFVRFYTTNHGDRAIYKCSTGYKLTGNMYVVCEFGTWRRHGGQPVACDAAYCDYPGTIEHGQVLLVGVIGKYEYRPYVRRIGHNQQIEFNCGKEYKRVGPAGATCVDGVWSPRIKPTCQPKKHPKLLYIFRGKRSVHSHEGHAKNVYFQDSSFSMLRSVPFFPMYSELPEIRQGHVINYPAVDDVPHGTTLTIECGPHFELRNNSQTIRCERGEWSAPPECLPVNCRWPGAIEHGEVLVVGVLGKYHYRTFIKLRTNDKIEFLCAEGHPRVGQRRSTCYYGQWHPRDKPRCVSADDNKLLHGANVTGNSTEEEELISEKIDLEKGFCEVPLIQYGGVANLPDAYYVPHNTTMRVVCELGYQVDDQEFASCEDGVWSRVPACLPDVLERR